MCRCGVGLNPLKDVQVRASTLHHTDTCLVPVIASTVLCIPDDGCREHPKHVE